MSETFAGFRRSGISEDSVRKILYSNSEKKLNTGIKVIDDVFGGIKLSDLVLVGAATGFGKTSLMTQIAVNVARQLKQVYMFALEAEDREIELRIIFQALAKENPRRMVYKKWYDNHYRDLDYSKALGEANLENLHLYYRTKEFSVEDFTRSAMAIKEKADLMITDHIHYFDLHGENENRELSKAIRKIRDVALLTRVPNILVGHLRKEGQGTEKKIVPEIDDFMGSSDLSKVCTKAIILGQARSKGDQVMTFFHFPKFRQHGSARNFLFACPFSVSKQTYASEYEVYYFKSNVAGTNLEKLDPKNLDWLG